MSSFHQTHSVEINGQNLHVLLTPPSSDDAPLFVMHHGMGSSALTWAVLAQHLLDIFPEPIGVLAFDVRSHGKSKPVQPTQHPDFHIDTLTSDCEQLVKHFTSTYPNPLVLIGHSMGGTVVSKLCKEKRRSNVRGVVVIDAVEGYAIQSLGSMPSLVQSWPSSFGTLDEAVNWALQHLQHSRESARISVPGVLEKRDDGRYYFIVDLLATDKYWDTWFKDLDKNFLQCPAARLLILAGTGRLDKELMVGQMQGKYQLVVLGECNHFLHEDAPSRVAHTLLDFWERNGAPIKIVPKFGTLRT